MGFPVDDVGMNLGAQGPANGGGGTAERDPVEPSSHVVNLQSLRFDPRTTIFAISFGPAPNRVPNCSGVSHLR